jgi:GH24 family phage-related lysozyme (muramidase)
VNTSQKGINLIKKYEGCKLVGYLCPAGIPTIGYGHTGTVLGSPVTVGMKITQSHAEKILKTDLKKYEEKVEKYSKKYNWTQNEFDAMVSFAYNLGSIDKLTVNGTRSKAVIADKILLYDKAGGVTLAGLTRRRKEEQALFLAK